MPVHKNLQQQQEKIKNRGTGNKELTDAFAAMLPAFTAKNKDSTVPGSGHPVSPAYPFHIPKR
jgi:hypothetical protein